MPDSSISKFFEKSRKERLDIVANFANLSNEELDILQSNNGGISYDKADKMVENAIGTFSLPLGIATNFKINSKDYIIPMVIEEPSVIAAASKGAKIARIKGGFEVTADESYSIGQIQVLDIDIPSAIQKITNSSNEILQLANSESNTLSKMGKGAKEISCKEIDTPSGKMLIVELLIDVGDAMGANITNTMCEAVSPMIEKISGGRTLLRILSNYSTRRIAKARAVFEKEAVGGEKVVNDIILAFEFADNDVYRAVTHNKGILNGIIAVANAVGQDSRAIEAAANAYAAKSGRYCSLSKWSKDNDGNLVGTLEIPLSVGIVGGIVNVHPVAKVCTKILGVSTAQELACVMIATGLAQNYSAIRALATEGIQKGHMRLHARNLAAAAGATSEQIDKIVQKMIEEKKISLDRAKELLEQI
ncbi:hydroxymethylglutaryl-CoA reductase, degradative [Marine Group I thaumarchaeote]|jgi:hydroxymethylglutaryl-CoA reductase|uniref:3-hydroxy-3-methylglutaryl coenzyme A reductase n=1 Tax=Marine Group I thaumarchaeote TaxID=2511932 RepID=A0A7K4MJQ4_9ARCH|nr:MAG: hydroxymethylglutaryl-CoA reductase, degradative [Nitrosopumilus sp. YT1]NMI82894.1 hydroxymethylglutaryl-CoA reductase, degradative [Candidatus Nitrosopumilus sp. MTA1]NWJ20080.1 hydroxymethylglutaryl-CoA reductase, degradative [Marine Group I thaumarchaeote]NWJ27991.1 hydroxymethylglutaryl-CoA reductase, degradative [Marine Group I thaumarchaeote]NWJ29444.1 hydroxymethylglutaryl-CoA reductase, degradative [Marine Group I thaumarchaeote]